MRLTYQEMKDLRKEVAEMLDLNVELSNDLLHYRELWDKQREKENE